MRVCVAVGVLGGLALAGLAVYLFTIGLDEAGKTASVVSAFVGLIGLALSFFGLVRSRPQIHNSRPIPADVKNVIEGPAINTIQARTVTYYNGSSSPGHKNRGYQFEKLRRSK